MRSAAASRLLQADLAYTRTFGGSPVSISGRSRDSHYYTLRVAAAALEQGADWLQQHHPLDSAACRAEAAGYTASSSSSGHRRPDTTVRACCRLVSRRPRSSTLR